jgi:hypothetical protein
MYVPSESNLLKGVLQSRVFQGLFSVYIAFEKAGIVEPFLRIENGIRAEGAYSLKATQVQIEELDFVLSI